MPINKGDIVRLRNGVLCDVVYRSSFGKLLLVERGNDGLPPTHWHNQDGTQWADEQSPLDVVELISSPAQGIPPVINLWRF